MNQSPSRPPIDWAVKLQLLTAAYFVLLFLFAYLVERIQFNILGLRDLAFSSDPSNYVNLLVFFINFAVSSSLVIGFIIIPIVYLFSWLISWISHHKFELAWWRTTRIHPIGRLLILLAAWVVFYSGTKLVEIQNLLLIQPERAQSDFVSLIVFPDRYSILRRIFFGVQLLTVSLLILITRWHWLSWSKLSRLLHMSLNIGFIGTILLFLVVLPITYAALSLPIEYPKITLELRKDVFENPRPLEGYLIKQTASGFIAYVNNSAYGKPGIVMLPQEAVAQVTLSDKPQSILSLHYLKSDKPFNEICGEKTSMSVCQSERLYFWLITNLVAITIIAILVLIQPVEAAQGVPPSEKQDKDKGVSTQNVTASNLSLLQTFYPFIISLGDKIGAVLNILDNSLRGENSTNNKENDALAFNIWKYDQKDGSLQQLTTGSNYRSLMPSSDGTQLAIIKDTSLGILNIKQGTEHIVNDRLPYSYILAWNTAIGEFLVLTQDRHLFRVKQSDGTSAEITFDKPLSDLEKKFTDPDTLIKLSQVTPKLTIISVIESMRGKWEVVENHEDYLEPKILFEFDNPIKNPMITQEGSTIFFLSNRIQK